MHHRSTQASPQPMPWVKLIWLLSLTFHFQPGVKKLQMKNPAPRPNQIITLNVVANSQMCFASSSVALSGQCQNSDVTLVLSKHTEQNITNTLMTKTHLIPLFKDMTYNVLSRTWVWEAWSTDLYPEQQLDADVVSVHNISFFTKCENSPRWGNAGRWPLVNLCSALPVLALSTSHAMTQCRLAPHHPLSPVVVMAAKWQDRPVLPVVGPGKEQHVKG